MFVFVHVFELAFVHGFVHGFVLVFVLVIVHGFVLVFVPGSRTRPGRPRSG